MSSKHKIWVKCTEIKDYYPNIQAGNLLKTLLYRLGLNEQEAYSFLNVANTQLPDPFEIFGVPEAVALINNYIREGRKIVIHGDFDADGICATGILWDYLYFQKKANAFPIIPNRVDEGYGLSEKTIKKAIDMGAEVIITVDCGIRDLEIVDKYKNKIDFIITDHHQFAINELGDVVLPDAKAVVHSAHPQSKFCTPMSGASTVWHLVRGLEKTSKNYSSKNDVVMNYLDLVAISTICDVIPLNTENRKLVLMGLEKIKQNKRLGLVELMKVAQVPIDNLQSYHIGFMIGPRLNAPGRVLNDAIKSLRLICTKNENQAQELSKELNDLNIQRQNLTEEFFQKAQTHVDIRRPAIVITGHNWPHGILGLIAGKLAEKYYKPVFVASIDQNDKIVGSSRSPLENFHINKALEYAKDHLTRFGGHKQAAGFASELNKFEGFEKKIFEFIEKHTSDQDFIKKTFADIEIDNIGALSIEEVKEIELLEPFGVGNPRPVFLLPGCRITNLNFFGKDSNHIKIQVSQGSTFITAKIFNRAHTASQYTIGSTYDLLGYLYVNEWNNRQTIEFEVIDIF